MLSIRPRQDKPFDRYQVEDQQWLELRCTNRPEEFDPLLRFNGIENARRSLVAKSRKSSPLALVAFATVGLFQGKRSLFWCPSLFGTTPTHLELGSETKKGEMYCRGSLTGDHSGAGKQNLISSPEFFAQIHRETTRMLEKLFKLGTADFSRLRKDLHQ